MDFLQKIVVEKRREIGEARGLMAREDWRLRAADLPPPLDFFQALADSPPIRVIAEIKKASPSAGVFRPDFDPVAIAHAYRRAGAACLSVLTDREFFQGSIEDLRAVARAVSLPVLRKDFILDECQILEARLAGASAVLLIAECLSRGEMADLAGQIAALAMTPLVEIHDPDNLEAAIANGASLIGINNRDLRTFKTDLATTLRLLPKIPQDRLVVSESGIRASTDLARLEAAGARAVLVGETLLRADDPGAKLRELIGSAR